MSTSFLKPHLFVLVAAFVSASCAAVLLWMGFAPDRPQTQSVAATIGLVSNNPNGLLNLRGFQAGLAALGYVEGENVTYLFSEKPTPSVELERAISQMLDDGAELIFTAGTPTGVAALKATRGSGVPVVFGVIADPVAAGVMTDLSRPGGNMTGVMLSENQARRLQLLRSIVPNATRILLAYNPEDPAPVSAAAQLQDAANAMGMTLVHAHARNDEEVTALLKSLPGEIDAIFMLPDSTVNRRIDDLIAVAVAHKLPVSGPSTAQVEAGALMSYGIVHHEVGVQASRIAARILRGGDPGTIPVETADFYLTINVAAAERIGLRLAESLLQQADFILRSDRLGE